MEQIINSLKSEIIALVNKVEMMESDNKKAWDEFFVTKFDTIAEKSKRFEAIYAVGNEINELRNKISCLRHALVSLYAAIHEECDTFKPETK